MTKTTTLLLMLLFASFASMAQSVGIGTTTPNGSAALDNRSTNRGLRIPTMTLAQRNAISYSATGLLPPHPNLKFSKNAISFMQASEKSPIANSFPVTIHLYAIRLKK